MNKRDVRCSAARAIRRMKPGLAQRLCLAAAAVLMAGTAWGSSPPATTTLGTRGSLSQPNPPITTNADGAWVNYTRAEDYPKILKLPLQFIPLASGQQLSVWVSVPADANGNAVAGSFPVVLTQTAYRGDLGNRLGTILPIDNTLVIGGADQYMIKRGYVSVSVDVLGTGLSGGEWVLIDGTEQEAYGEAVDWVLRQPWCSGTIGVAGTSYLGITALLTAAQGNPAVKAAFAQIPLGDPYRGTIMTGGLGNAVFLGAWAPLTQQLSIANGAELKNYPQYAEQIQSATQQHEADIEQNLIPVVDETLAGTVGLATDDGDFWSIRSPLEVVNKINVPTFIIGGEHDIFQRDEPLLYEQLKNKVTTKLLVMEGAHAETLFASAFNSDQRWSGGAPASSSLLLQWFDQYLKGMPVSADKVPNVTQFINGYGRYRFSSSTDWPHPQATAQRYYLHGDLRLDPTRPLTREATHTVKEPTAVSVTPKVSHNGDRLKFIFPLLQDGSECSISYQQWTLGVAMLLLGDKSCYHDDDVVEDAQKALEYQTSALAADWYINGPIEADIWMSTTATQAALSVRVDDLGTDGTAVPLTNGLQAASFRAVDTSRSRYINGVMIQPWHPFTAVSELPVIPGQPMLVPVEIFPTAALIRAGHRLRIAISSSNQAQGIWLDPDVAAAKGGVTTIYNDPQHPSSVVLPVVPTSVLR